MSKYVMNEGHPPAIYDLHAVSVSNDTMLITVGVKMTTSRFLVVPD